MKQLYVKGVLQDEAERIVKTFDSIIGYNSDSQVFCYNGISDWSQYQLGEGQDWDVDEQTAKAAFLLDLDFRISLLELGVR